jgi:hypothetical protein
MTRLSIFPFLFALQLVVSSVQAESASLGSVFNGNMSPKEAETLREGNLLIKNLSSYRKVMLQPVTPEAEQLLADLRSLKPAYLAEVVLIVPVNQSESFQDVLFEKLGDVERYETIPYFSAQHKIWDVLYSFVDVLARNSSPTKVDVSAYGAVSPFQPYSFEVHLRRAGGALFYQIDNVSEIQLNGYSCVGPRKFQIRLAVFPVGENLVAYGVGGVNAPYVPFLNDRIQTAFINRVSTFCTYMMQGWRESSLCHSQAGTPRVE